MRVIEMFAGVGGFRVGLSKVSQDFDFVWANQWEPGKKKQPAWECYERNYGEGSCLNKNISDVKVDDIPDFDLLTAGFPCQDYSVAKSLKYSGGIEGKKGVLWWDVERVIRGKLPKYVLLENVDRLLMSPSKQRGRDFAIILHCLMNNGYHVEWKVVNPASYGMPQKRKRIFIWASRDGKNVLDKAFPFSASKENSFPLEKDLLNVSNNFGKNSQLKFENYGVASNFEIKTMKVSDIYNGEYTNLKDIVQPLKDVSSDFLINEKDLEAWKPFKLGRKIERISKDGFPYIYSEGRMSFPDSLDKPARTIITAEGGSAPSRFKHIILQDGVYRRLTPIELERVQMFPDNHTQGYTDIQRAFFMGNALVTGVVSKIALEIMKDQ